MGYWKREYTERKTGKPLFKPEPKQGEATGHTTPAPADGDQAPSDAHAGTDSSAPAEAPEQSRSPSPDGP